jgi:hypothetical protein
MVFDGMTPNFYNPAQDNQSNLGGIEYKVTGRLKFFNEG